jgi:hypothetical protein
MKLEDLRRDIRNAGLSGTAFDLGYRLINRCAPFMMLKMMGITMATLNRRILALPPGYRTAFPDQAELRRYAQDPAYDMTDAFLDQALAKGDRCYAILEGDTLASYGWYSLDDTHITGELSLRFSREWMYMYKGYTLPRYRGLRFHAVGMAALLDEASRLGLRGLLCFVEANNYSSLKSAYRLGYRDVGMIVTLKALGQYWVRIDHACATHGFAVTSLEPQPLPAMGSVKSLP